MPAQREERCDSARKIKVYKNLSHAEDSDFISYDAACRKFRGPLYKISYDLSQDYLKFIVRSTYDSDLHRVKISLMNIVS